MLFNTLDFWLFFAVVYGVYRLLGMRGQNLWLLGSSYVFYGFWDYRFVLLLALSTSVDWLLARRISREPSRERAKKWVAMSVVVNLIFLGAFKYFNFFVGSFGALLQALGLNPHLPVIEILLPVGISFYTFQSMSYIVDVYRGDVEPASSFVEFALFVAFFPHMVAGPIMKAKVLLPQMGLPRVITAGDLTRGFHLAMVGLFKKVVVADNLDFVADLVFSRQLGFVPGVLHVGVLAFAFEIYADFSGYSDIARGLARMMGFTLIDNFETPYFATSITDFWRRWHISLSTWLREYLYVPLGGNRGTPAQTYRNLMITMVLGGLWHGAAAHFVVWGAYQGVLLSVERWFRGRRRGLSTLGRFGAPGRVAMGLATFHFVCLGWIYFRATPGSPLLLMTRRFLNPLGWTAMPWTYLAPVLLAVTPLLILDIARQWSGRDLAILHLPWPARGVLYAGLTYAFILCGNFQANAFIYFRF